VTERWLPVVGYEGLYEVSDQGRVRTYVNKHGHRACRACARERARAKAAA
jgi:NUMOD4 motif